MEAIVKQKAEANIRGEHQRRTDITAHNSNLQCHKVLKSANIIDIIDYIDNIDSLIAPTKTWLFLDIGLLWMKGYSYFKMC